jgi:predicted site-specific integrase-resolvase
MSVKEAANAWGVTIQMVRRYCQKGMVSKVKQENSGRRIPMGTPRPGTQKPEEEKPKQLSLVNQIKYQWNCTVHG